jgi:RNA polymerase sigma-70 factor (ECF subfamily)
LKLVAVAGAADTLKVFAAALPLALKGDGESKASSPADSPSDEALFTRLQTGEQEALGCLFQRYARIVRSAAARILRDAAEADDLVQDLFLFIYRKCAIFDSSKSSARSWIVQMAYHRSIERRRYLTTRQFYAQMEIESNTIHMVGTPTAESDYSAEAVFGRNGLNKVLKALSEDQREPCAYISSMAIPLRRLAKRWDSHWKM